MKRSFLSAMGAVVTALVLGFPVPVFASAQTDTQGRNLILATGGTSGTYYPFGGAMVQIWNKNIPGMNVTAPAVVALGIPVLAAHMFTFYFGIVADITPPVALAAYAGSAIAKSNPFKTGVMATKIANAAFIIPYIFALNPTMLLINASPLPVLQILVTSLIGMIAVGAATEGWLFGRANPFERVLFLIGGLAMIDPHSLTDLIGIAVIAVPLLLQLFRARGVSLPGSRKR